MTDDRAVPSRSSIEGLLLASLVQTGASLPVEAIEFLTSEFEDMARAVAALGASDPEEVLASEFYVRDFPHAERGDWAAVPGYAREQYRSMAREELSLRK